MRKDSRNFCNYKSLTASKGMKLKESKCVYIGRLFPGRSLANTIISRKERGLGFKYIRKKELKSNKASKDSIQCVNATNVSKVFESN